MTRRITALAGIVVLLGLVLLLLWRVYVHHETGGEIDEPATVSLDARRG